MDRLEGWQAPLCVMCQRRTSRSGCRSPVEGVAPGAGAFNEPALPGLDTAGWP